MKQHPDFSTKKNIRDFDYLDNYENVRIEYPIISEMVEKNSTVIDLGCGNGSLMEMLIREKNVTARGIELSSSGVAICKQKGLNVSEGRIDVPFTFKDNEFDFAICNVTILCVMYPEILLKEMKRIARYQIISFNNFGYLHNRLDMLIYGRMPRPGLSGYEWYDTGQIHQLSIDDFEKKCRELKFNFLKKVALSRYDNIIMRWLAEKSSNLFSVEAIYLLTG